MLYYNNYELNNTKYERKFYVWDETIFNYKTIKSIFFLKYILIFSSCITSNPNDNMSYPT